MAANRRAQAPKRATSSNLEPVLPAETRAAFAENLRRMKAAMVTVPDSALSLLESEAPRGSTRLLAATLAGVATELHNLKRRERRLRTYFDHATDGMAAVDREGRWIEVNDALCAMLGRTRADLLTLPCPALAHPEDCAALTAALAQLAGTQAGRLDTTVRLLHSDGRALAVRIGGRRPAAHRDEPLPGEAEDPTVLLFERL
jgi:PAS domain S-box-containing protein